MKRKRFEKGFSLIEVMVASTILTGVVAGAMTMQNMTFNRTIATNDKAFATQKAMQMFEELRAYVQANRESDIAKLQNYSDGSSFNHVLTTEKRELSTNTGSNIYDLTNPADPLSGNTKIAGSNHWKFLRQVQIKPVANDANARYVSVAVWYADPQNNNFPKGTTDRPLAVISGILKTNITQEPPTQMYDLFVIAMENSPSWWVDQADLRPSFERTLLDLESRNPGLIFRRHFITRSGFGRDPHYLPYINDGGNTNAQDLPWVYLYPGKVDNILTQNYLLDFWRGRRRTDDITNYRDNLSSSFKTLNKLKLGNTGENFMQYAVADQFNHVMRYPEQLAMENRLRAEKPEDFKDSPSLVRFLEEMNSGLNKNSLIINLHGELLPLPPLRNYSDPAKAPDKFARKLTGNQNQAVPTNSEDIMGTLNEPHFVSLMNKRVVTHPENLQANNGSLVSWRVYPFEEYGPGSSGLDSDGTAITRDNNNIPQISLFIPTIGAGPNYTGNGNGFLNYPNFTPSSVTGLTVERLVGGRVTGNNTNTAGFQPFAWWTNSSSGFRAITDTHNPASGNARIIAPLSGGSSINQMNGAALPADGNSLSNISSIRVASTANISAAADREALKGMLMVLGYGTADEKVVRITQINGAGNNVISFTPSVNVNNVANIRTVAITRHKDYDAVVVDKTMYGQPHRGIHITLYDTPTRHNCFNNTDCNNGASTAKGGIRSDHRLDGLEYIPAPINTTWPSSGAPTYSLVDTSTTNWKNSARWRVNLDTSTYGTNFNNQMLTLETRMVTAADASTPATTYPVMSTPDTNSNGVYDPCEIGSNPITNNESVLCDGLWGDGDTYVPNNPDTTTINEHNTTVRPNVYNISRTYVYMNHKFTEAQVTTIANSVTSDIPSNTLTIPRAEQAQFQGHPMYNPYLDVKQLHRYNRHFVSGIDNSDGRDGFERASGPDWNTVHVDLNWFFQLYTNGIMHSNSVYNSISGYSNYYYAFGGEIGSDNNNNNKFFDIRTQPWSQTDTGTATASNESGAVRDIINDAAHSVTGGERVIMSTDLTTNGGANERWRMRQHLGQLYPDNNHAFWLANGNLPSLDYNETNHNADLSFPPTGHRFFRVRSDTAPRAQGYNTHRRMQGEGAPTFMNGNIAANPTTSNAGLAHSSTGNDTWGELTNAAATDAGSQLMNAYNLTLSDRIKSNRPYRLDGSNVTGPYTSDEMKGIRNRLAFVNTTTGVTSGSNTTQNVYYRHESSPTTLTSSSFVKLTRPNPTSPTTDLNGLAGYVLVNGFAQATGSGTQEIARFSLAASLQTFMDAGDRNTPGNASGRTVQLPRVQINEPRSSQIYVDPTTIGVDANIAWMRWDNQKYSPAYPNAWRDSTRLLYNVKYSTNNKRDWVYADDHSAVAPEYQDTYNASHAVMGSPETSTANNWDKTFSWNVSALPEGNYVLRVEVYRENFATGYSYHDVFVTIER